MELGASMNAKLFYKTDSNIFLSKHNYLCYVMLFFVTIIDIYLSNEFKSFIDNSKAK